VWQYAALLVPTVPGLLWLALIYRTDRYEPEPKRLVALTFFFGVLSILPALLIERLAERAYPYLGSIEAAAGQPVGAVVDAAPLAVACFLIIGPAEELFKFLAVRLYIYRHPEFDEPLDGVIYSSAAALGFASLENVFYVAEIDNGHLSIRWSLLGVRAFLALPGHVIFAAMWGAALGRRRFDPRYAVWPSLLVAAGLHGLYDFILMWPPTRPAIILYMSLMVPIVLRQIAVLRADSPFAPTASVAPAAAPAPPSAAGGEPDGEPKEPPAPAT
jgi:RsiW-degrading membrane proteinase PrsW (M82 family)